MLEFLGPTVLTAELGDYRNHRRLLSPIFLEGNNQLVWLEATHFIDSWFLKEKSNLKSTSDSSGQQLLEEDFLSVSLKLFMVNPALSKLSSAQILISLRVENQFSD